MHCPNKQMTTIEKAVRVNVTKWDWAPLFKSSFFLELLDKSPIKCTYGAVQCVVGRLVLKEKILKLNTLQWFLSSSWVENLLKHINKSYVANKVSLASHYVYLFPFESPTFFNIKQILLTMQL